MKAGGKKEKKISKSTWREGAIQAQAGVPGEENFRGAKLAGRGEGGEDDIFNFTPGCQNEWLTGPPGCVISWVYLW